MATKDPKTVTVHGEELIPSDDPSKPSQLEPYPTGNPPGQTAGPSPEIPIPPEELCPPGQVGGEAPPPEEPSATRSVRTEDNYKKGK